MSDARGPVRHGSRARRPVRPMPPARHATDAAPPPSDDLQAVFAALARRSKLPTGPDARPAEVLRAAGIPLLMAALVAGGHVPGADGGDPGNQASGPPPSVNGWTVTTLQPEGGSGSGTGSSTSGSSASSGASGGSPASATSSASGAAPAPGAKASSGDSSSSGAAASGAAASSGSTHHHTPAHRPSPAVPTHRPPATRREPPPSAPVTPPGKPRVTYTVRAGDTLASVAARSGRDADRIAEANHLRPGQALVAGQVLVLPATPSPHKQKPTTPTGPKTTPQKTTPAKATPQKTAPQKTTPQKATPQKTTPQKTPPEAPQKTPPRSVTRAYVVRQGDTLTSISTQQKVKLTEVLALNHLTPQSVIHPGDRILLPAAPGPVSAQTTQGQPGAGTTSPGATRAYVVEAGDSLIGISQKQHVKLQDILELNHLHLESTIRPGDKLLLPAAVQAAAPGHHRAYPPAVVAAADANRKALAHAKVPSREQVKAMVVSTARSMGVDPALALGVAYLESGFQQRMVSPANAVGVMQVIPSAGRWASSMVGRPLDLLDTKDNITAGVALLRALLDAADTEAQAIAGYYQGLGSVQRSGMFDDTRRYVANVQTLKARFAAGT